MDEINDKITKICTKCKIEKELDNFFDHKTGKYGKTAVCKECTRKSRQKGFKGYYNDEEKEMTYSFLTSLGWSRNEENDIWYKPEGWKDENGNWTYPEKIQTNLEIIKKEEEEIKKQIQLEKDRIIQERRAEKQRIKEELKKQIKIQREKEKEEQRLLKEKEKIDRQKILEQQKIEREKQKEIKEKEKIDRQKILEEQRTQREIKENFIKIDRELTKIKKQKQKIIDQREFEIYKEKQEILLINERIEKIEKMMKEEILPFEEEEKALRKKRGYLIRSERIKMRNTGKENQYLKDIPEIRKLNINEQDRSKPRITRILKKTFPPEVEEKIRSLYFNDKKMTMQALADMYQCSYTRINFIINYKNDANRNK